MSQSLERALVAMISLAEGPQSLEQVAATLDVHKSTALRLLRTCESLGFVRRDAAHRFALGARLFSLGYQALEDFDLRRVAAPHLRALGERLGHTAHLGVLEAGQVVYIDKYDSSAPVRMNSRIGGIAPLHATAMAKVILAHLDPPEAERLLAGATFTPFTERTITDPDAFRQELARVRARGWAANAREHEAAIYGVAAPVRDAGGTVLGGVSVSAPAGTVNQRSLAKLRPQVVAAADAISTEYGWSPGTARPGARSG